MIKRNNKKGFTIVELVIVIAVIAILAAVLIPTFAGIIKKANLSSDQQAVRNMNVALATDEATNGKPQNLLEATMNMAKAGYDFENYKPLSSDYRFFWDSVNNKIVLAEKETGNIIYPTEYEGQTLTSDFKSLYRDPLISTEKISAFEEKIDAAADKVVEIENVDELAALSALVNGETEKAKDFAGYTFNLKADTTYDLADIVWIPVGEAEEAPFKGTINGNGATISGLTTEGYTTDVANASTLSSGQTGVTYGFVGFAENATIKNLKFAGANIQLGTTGKEMGLVVGTAIGGVTVEDCTVTNSTIVGKSKVGGIVGYIQAEETAKSDDPIVVIKNCHFDGTIEAKDTGSSVRAGGIVGAMVLTNQNYATISNCTVSGNIVAEDIAGALVGHLYNATGLKVDNCTVTATLKAEYTGAIVGYWANSVCPVEIGENVKVGDAVITAPTDALFGNFSANTYNLITSEGTYKFTNSVAGAGDEASKWIKQ